MNTRIGTDNLMYVREDWNIVRNYDEFITYIILEGIPDKVSFDHDLDDSHDASSITEFNNFYNLEDRTNTGLDAMRWLISYCIEHKLPIPKIYIHTQNVVAYKVMIEEMGRYK